MATVLGFRDRALADTELIHGAVRERAAQAELAASTAALEEEAVAAEFRTARRESIRLNRQRKEEPDDDGSVHRALLHHYEREKDLIAVTGIHKRRATLSRFRAARLKGAELRARNLFDRTFILFGALGRAQKGLLADAENLEELIEDERFLQDFSDPQRGFGAFLGEVPALVTASESFGREMGSFFDLLAGEGDSESIAGQAEAGGNTEFLDWLNALPEEEPVEPAAGEEPEADRSSSAPKGGEA